MESMDYNNYFAPAPHTFGYLGFSHDTNVLGHGANNEGNGAVEVSIAACVNERYCIRSITCADVTRVVEHGILIRRQWLCLECVRIRL